MLLDVRQLMLGAVERAGAPHDRAMMMVHREAVSLAESALALHAVQNCTSPQARCAEVYHSTSSRSDSHALHPARSRSCTERTGGLEIGFLLDQNVQQKSMVSTLVVDMPCNVSTLVVDMLSTCHVGCLCEVSLSVNGDMLCKVSLLVNVW